MLNEDQKLLRDSAATWMQNEAPVSHFRSLRDSASTLDEKHWGAMVENGWTATCIDEAHGGIGFGVQGMGIIAQQAGRTLAMLPLVSGPVLCAQLIQKLGNAKQQAHWLPRIASGQTRMALAVDERSHHAPYATTLAATAKDDAYSLSGSKVFVMDANHADTLLVVGRTAGEAGEREGLGVFIVPTDAKGVSLEPLNTIDSRDWANIVFSDVSDAELLESADNTATALDSALDCARAVLAAEMLGSCEELFERTITYLKERQQFGVAIGSFQALKHRAAWMFCEIELLQSAVHAALAALDNNADDAAVLTSLAKAKAGEVYRLVSNEAVQMHGGMGVTDELDMGLFLKRARTVEQAYGGQVFHRRRYADLNGF